MASVIISHRIKKKEFRMGVIPPDDLNIILKSFDRGIFTIIKGDRLPRDSRLIKIYATTVAGARRIVFLVDAQSDTGFLLFYRSKQDKIGQNISIKNPVFKKTLQAYLDLLDGDLDSKSIDIYQM